MVPCPLRLSEVRPGVLIGPFEADDYPTLARALGPLNAIDTGHTSPILALDQAFPMAEAGAFRMT